ncbi:MAG: histidine phosphatase family protein [Gammaproteobacteria bacterium]
MNSTAVFAQERDAEILLDSLRSGGHVIVMRHASSPRDLPDAAAAAPGNVKLERQLDAEGRNSAVAMGNALRRIGVPIGEVLSSSTFRAMQTAQYLALGEAQGVAELGDGGQGMRQDAAGERSMWLRDNAAQAPPPGTNRILITHTPNIAGAFGEAAAGIAEGESLIVRPERGEGLVIGRVRIEQWPKLASP